MSGSLQDNEIEEFLLVMNEKGASINEISSAASVMRDKSLKFNIGDGTHIDTCGTGGTGLHIFNCSTASAFVAAACGAKVTKHGNKSVSSKTGSADFLLEAGADISHDRSLLESIFRKTGFIFLFCSFASFVNAICNAIETENWKENYIQSFRTTYQSLLCSETANRSL